MKRTAGPRGTVWMAVSFLAAATACGSSDGGSDSTESSGGSGGANGGCVAACLDTGASADDCAKVCAVGAGGSGGSGAAGGAAGAGNAAGAGATGAVGGSGGGPTVPAGRCSMAPPPGAQAPPPPQPYSGGTCPMLAPGKNSITSNGNAREFLLIMPEDYDPAVDQNLPVLFMWHWLQGSANSFLEKGEVQQAANDKRFIAVLPEKKGDVGFPVPLIPLDLVWPYDVAQTEARMEEEFGFFDDMLSCVAEQFSVNLSCVSSAGVSAGALWMGQLIWGRGDYLSSVLSLSGGTGGQWIKPYRPSLHKMPVLALWGGPTDVCGVIIQFEPMTKDLEANLTMDGHFLIECQHNCGHGVPPITPPPGLSRFDGLWSFAFDHPYWLSDGDSPYLTDGFPPGVPEWCAIGMNNAVPRTDPLCEEPGCPL